jgi:flagellar biogenesis protein FliO
MYYTILERSLSLKNEKNKFLGQNSKIQIFKVEKKQFPPLRFF